MQAIELLTSGWAGALAAIALTPQIALIIGLAAGAAGVARALSPVIRAIDLLSNQVFLTVRWMALALVLIQFANVVLRYAFGIGFIAMQEALLYLHGSLFMLAAAGALLHEGHVRIDVFYRGASARTKALIDFTGAYVFLLPVVAVIAASAIPYVQASWSVYEGSKETSGIPYVYVLKSAILVFAAMLYLQAISFAARAALTLLGADVPPKPAGPTVIA
jgi:TRAP-type mannitol/chloroaromatic compound transport system permease small subunit